MESFRLVNYLFYLIDLAIISLKKGFEQYQQYESTFDFLFTSHKLQLLNDTTLKFYCNHFEQTLKHNDHSNIDGRKLCVKSGF